MKQKCENLDQCGFFKNFMKDAEVLKRGWISLYCEDIETSEKCERKRIKKQTGKAPVDNMAPTGKIFKYFA